MVKKELFIILAASFLLFGCSNNAPFEGSIDPNDPTSAQETDELHDGDYEKVYDYCAKIFDQLINEFNEEALDPDIFFAEYGVTSVYEEKMKLLEIEGLQAQDALDGVFQEGRGTEADWEIWTNKMNELHVQKTLELEEAYEVMLAY